LSAEELKTVNESTFVQVYVKVAHVVNFVYFVYCLIFFFSPIFLCSHSTKWIRVSYCVKHRIF